MSIPVIACGGAGTVRDVRQVVVEAKADAVCVASLLHYHTIQHLHEAGDFSVEGNDEFLRSRRGFSKVEATTLPQIKSYLAQGGVACRATALESVDA